MRRCLAWVLCAVGGAALAGCGDDTAGTGSGGGGGEAATSTSDASTSTSSASVTSTTTGGEGGEGPGSTTTSTGGNGTGGEGTGGEGTGGEGGAAAAAWVVFPELPDETIEEDGERFTSPHYNDDVFSLHFDSVDHGVIGTYPNTPQNFYGGAIFSSDGESAIEVVQTGNDPNFLLDFFGFKRLANGSLMAMTANTGFYFHSEDDGDTWTRTLLGAPDYATLGELLHEDADGTWTLMSQFGVMRTTDVPGPTALWSDVMFPASVPTVPNPYPADWCHSEPSRPFSAPNGYPWAFGSEDGQTFVYGLRLPAQDEPSHGICMSQDGGETWRPKLIPLDLLPEDHDELWGPRGVLFLDENVGFAYHSVQLFPRSSWIAKTTDGGDTWTIGELPAGFNVDASSFDFNNMFFAPDGIHGWVIGYDFAAGRPLVLRTENAGDTWERLGSVNGPDFPDVRLYSGFALDEDHIWLGGEDGFVGAHADGGL